MFTTLMDLDRAFRSFDELRRRMDSAFDEFQRGSGRAWTGYGPQSNIFDTGESLVILADVPGVAEEDLAVTITKNAVTIRGERKVEVPEGYSVHRRERSPMTFSRSYAIPFDVDADKAMASLKNGVLTLNLPKTPASLPKQITVKAD